MLFAASPSQLHSCTKNLTFFFCSFTVTILSGSRIYSDVTLLLFPFEKKNRLKHSNDICVWFWNDCKINELCVRWLSIQVCYAIMFTEKKTPRNSVEWQFISLCVAFGKGFKTVGAHLISLNLRTKSKQNYEKLIRFHHIKINHHQNVEQSGAYSGV